MLNLGKDAGDAQAREPLVKDVSEANFMAEVVEASRQVPIIVDFWAPWCGPCKQLTPLLETAVKEAGGKVRLVKVNVDENQALAGQMQIQSIPAVYGFVDGRPVDGFMGAQGPAQIKEFIRRLAAQSPGANALEEVLEAAEALLGEGRVPEAAQSFAAVLQEDEANLRALAGLAQAYLATGDVEKAKGVLSLAPADAADPRLNAVKAQIELAEASADAGEVAELRRAVEARPGDLQARLDLAMALIAAHDNTAAIDELLEIFRRDREWNDGAAKAQLIKLFDSLGPKDPVGQKGRRRFSSMVFS